MGDPAGPPRAAATAPAIAVRDLEVVYGGRVRALAGVSLDLAPGGALAVLGPNGAGKTTLLRAVTGLLGAHGGSVTAGRVTVGGRTVGARGPAWREAGAVVALGVRHVLEGRRVFADLSVDENLAAGAFTRRDRAGVEADRERVFALFPPLARRRSTAAGHLSGGEQQMLAIGRALMGGPRVLLLDEPSLGLAPRVVSDIGRALQWVRERGASLLVADQHPVLAAGLADEACLLEGGRVVAQGPAAAVAADARRRALTAGTA